MRRDEIEDKRAYEEECVVWVKKAFSGRNELRWLEETGRALRHVELRGEFPDTELLVTIHDGRPTPPRDRTFSYALWGEDTRIADRGSDLMPDAKLMAANIFDWTMEE